MDDDSLRAWMHSIDFNQKQLAERTRTLEKCLDTRATPWRRRVMFRLDGWPSWTTVADHPAWRPWRRWWTS